MTMETTASWTAAEREAFEAKRRSRNLAIGLLLAALVVLFFGITVVRMAPGMQNGKPQVGQSESGPVAAPSAPVTAPAATPSATPSARP